MSSSASSPSARPPSHTSDPLFARARLGDATALGLLVARYLPRLHQWAHGRLHRWARSAVDTSDVIHDVVVRTLPRVGRIELRGQRALAAYLQEAVRNRIRDEHRHLARRGVTDTLSESLVDIHPSPLQQGITSELAARYRDALARLEPPDRELIVAHVELDYTHQQLGCMTNRTANAARMALQRAMHRLAEQLRHA